MSKAESVYRKGWMFWLCFMWGSVSVLAQALPDTVLQEVSIQGLAPRQYTKGQRVTHIDSTARLSLIQHSLTDLLMQESALFVREYGSGMAAGISFRGTSPSHTAVLWHGVNINSFTLGSADLGNLPVFLFDQVAIHHGAGSALYGSDAIGGAIHLGRSPSGGNASLPSGWEARYSGGFGSFGRWFQGATVKFRKARTTMVTKAYFQRVENDFPFQNTARFGFPRERQENAAIRQWGAMQEITTQLGKGQLSLDAWFNQSQREIMPTMGNNLRPALYETLEDQHLRAVLSYTTPLKKGSLKWIGGYVYDDQLFNESSTIIMHRLLSRMEWEQTLGLRWSVRAGGEVQYFMPQVERYEDGLQEMRTDYFFSLHYKPWHGLQFSASQRQTFVTGFNSPLSPTLGAEWKLWHSGHYQLDAKGAAAISYRVPTFNDRYWQPGGNPNLLAETSRQLEAGLVQRTQTGDLKLTVEATYFRMLVDNWIIWSPRGAFWAPDNLRQVSSRGLELSLLAKWPLGRMAMQLQGQYAYNRAINLIGLSAFDRSVGKQLAHTPLHRGTATWQVQWGKWSALGNVQVTGLRYLTAVNESSMPGFAVANAQLGWQTHWQGLPIAAQFRINNLFNTPYQNMPFLAMPGIHYQFTFFFTPINKNQI
jgi:iron complex outermembrane receptor protein